MFVCEDTYVCVWLYVRIYMHAYIYVHVCTCMLSVCDYINIHIYAQTNIHIYAFDSRSREYWASVCAFVFVGLHVHMNVYM